jgi:hypothetical protein
MSLDELSQDLNQDVTVKRIPERRRSSVDSRGRKSLANKDIVKSQ